MSAEISCRGSPRAADAAACGTHVGHAADQRSPPVSPAQGARGGRGGSRLASPSTPRDTRLEARRTLRPKVRARYLRAPRAPRAPRRVRHRSWGLPGGWKRLGIGAYAPRARARDRADPMVNPPHAPALVWIAHLSLGSCRPRSRAAARRGRMRPPPAAQRSGTRRISPPPPSPVSGAPTRAHIDSRPAGTPRATRQRAHGGSRARPTAGRVPVRALPVASVVGPSSPVASVSRAVNEQL